MKALNYILAIVAIGVVLFFVLRKNDSIIPTPAPVGENNISGCYVAHLGKDVYTLSITSENNGKVGGMLAYNNYQKDSSSGAFTGTYVDGILLGNYSFSSEGMDSNRQVIFKKEGDTFIQGFGPVKVVSDTEQFTDVSAVTYDPKSTFVKSPNCTEHFIDSTGTISLDHNAFFKSFSGDSVPTKDWRLGSLEHGIVLGTVVAQRTFMPGTNFSDARLTVGRSNDVSAIKSCTAAPLSGSGTSDKGAKMIDGYSFKKFQFSDAAAGNRYDTTSYAGIFDGDCYVIEYTIHSTNIGNYSADQGIKEFDKSKIENEMEKIINSFKFLISSN